MIRSTKKGILIVRLDKEMPIVSCNNNMCDILGYSSKELCSKNINDIHPEIYFDNLIKNLRDDTQKTDIVALHKNGTKIDLEIDVSTIMLNNKKHLIEVFSKSSNKENLKKEQKVKNRLQNSEKLSHTIINKMEVPISIVDNSMKIIFANEELLRWNEKLGINKDIIGKHLFKAYPFLGKKVKKEYEWVFANKDIYQTEEKTIVKEKPIYTQTKKIPIIENGIVTKIITVIRDITEEKNNILKIELLNKELKKHSSFLEKKIRRLEQNNISLTKKEKQVIYAMAKYPQLNDRELSLKISIKRSTITSIKNRLKSERLYDYKIIPNYSIFGYNTLSIIFGSFSKDFHLHDKFIDFSKKKGFIVSFITKEQFFLMFVSSKITDISLMTNEIFKSFSFFDSEPKIINFPLELTSMHRLFESSDLLASLLDIKSNINKDINYPFNMKQPNIKISKNMKRTMHALAKYPNSTTTELAKKLNLTRSTVANAISKLSEHDLFKKILIPNIHKFKTIYMDIFTLNFPIELRNRNKNICKKTQKDIVILENEKTALVIRILKESEVNIYDVPGKYIAQPDMFRLNLKEIRYMKYDFANITKNIKQ